MQAILYKKGSGDEPALPRGMHRLSTTQGFVHYDPKTTTPREIHDRLRERFAGGGAVANSDDLPDAPWVQYQNQKQDDPKSWGAIRGESYGEAYDHNLAAERERMADYKKDNPTTSELSELAGGMASGTAEAGGLWNTLKNGAQYGAVYGAGRSDGDLSDRGIAATRGAGEGALVGGLLHGGMKVAGAIAAPFTRNVAAVVNPEKHAMGAIARDLERDAVAIPDARAALQAAQAEGKPMTIGDLGGRNTMGLNRAVATGKSEGAQRVAALHEARQLDAPARTIEWWATDRRRKTAPSFPDPAMAHLERIHRGGGAVQAGAGAW